LLRILKFALGIYKGKIVLEEIYKGKKLKGKLNGILEE
jgi:hypothetical protein